MFAIVGLGNPGPSYAGTRHNAGYRVVEALSRRLAAGKRFNLAWSICATARSKSQAVVLAQPLSYMNCSGKAVKELLAKQQVALTDFLLIHDDLDLPLGTIRLKRGGGSAGHRGVVSVIEALGTADFMRLRFGIGRPAGEEEAADFVLNKFSDQEHPLLEAAVDKAVEAIICLLEEGLDRAMNIYH